MIQFNYKLTSYSKFLHDLAVVFGTEMQGNVLLVPEHIGTGFLSVVAFNGGDTLVYNYSLHEDLVVKREKDNSEFYTLVFDEIQDTSKFSFEIGQDLLEEERVRNAAIYLTSFLFDTRYTLFAGLEVKGMRVRLSTEWLKEYLHLAEMEDVLESYVALKTENVWSKPVDAESRELLHHLLQKPEDANLLFYQNKVLRIVELFFDWLRQQSDSFHRKPIGRSDIESAQKIESILTAGEVTLPPTIKELSRAVAMSESKLKKVFKIVYGLPIYVYFQKNRMEKARILLMSGNYSIKDVGYGLGYSNLSNFTLAFKKEFGRLPSDVVKEFK